jgi:hypothetical protein
LLPAFLAALALVGAQADDPKPPPRPSQQKKPAPDRALQTKLSAEDEALVKDLALVENADLLKDLDLFEGKEQDQGAKDPPARQP